LVWNRASQEGKIKYYFKRSRQAVFSKLIGILKGPVIALEALSFPISYSISLFRTGDIKKLFGTGLPIKACVLVLVHGTESAMFFPVLEKYSLNAKDIFLVSFISWPSFIIFVGKLCPLGFKVISCLIPFQVFLIFLLLAVK
jgi:hypothetical protein